MRALVTLMTCLVALGASAPAAAQQATAPPGNAGIDEYVETVPGATGAKPSQGGETGGAGPLPPDVTAALGEEGPDGEQLARVIEQTAPAASNGAGAGRFEAPRGDATTGGPGKSPLAALAAAAAGTGSTSGMGAALPLLIIGTLAVAIAAVVLRRRSAR